MCRLPLLIMTETIILFLLMCKGVIIINLITYRKKYFSRKLFLTKCMTPYVISGDERIIFEVRLTPESESYIIQKVLTPQDYDQTKNVYWLILSDTDTDIEPHHYYYGVALRDTENALHTISEGRFIVLPSSVR